MTTTRWVTVSDAVILAKRSKTQIYLWAKQGHVQSRRNARGVMEVLAADVLKAEATMVRGRPRGSARPPGWPTKSPRAHP